MLKTATLALSRFVVAPSGALPAPAPNARANRPATPDTQSTNQPETRAVDRKPLLLAIVTLASLAYLAGLVHYAQVRPIDGDEGYYTSAARLVWEGKTPYRNFSYPQGPLLPYVYSWIWGIHPRSLISMRFLSVACGGTAVFLWGVCLLCVKKLPSKVALATFAIILMNPYWVSWNVVVKTFAVSNLLMSVATICLYAGLHSERPRWYFISGLALGMCASARLLYAPLIPFVLLWMFCGEWRSSRPPYAKTLTFLAGATCGLLPIIVSFAGDPRAFIFNNVRYHPLLASHLSFRHTIHMYLSIILSLSLALYFVAEVLLGTVGGLSLLKLHKKRKWPYDKPDYEYFKVAFLMLVVYVATALIPFPPFDQYFDSPLAPFLIPFVAEGLRVTFQSGRKWAVLCVALIVPTLFYLEVNRDALQCSSSPALRISSYRKVTQVIQANSKADDIVLSFWPGYVFESGREYFPGSENKFNYSITGKMSSEDRSRYHVVSRDEVMNALSTRALNLFVTYPRVFDNHDDNVSAGELQAFRSVINSNYSSVGTIDDIEVYQRKPSPQPIVTTASGIKPADSLTKY